MNVFDSSLVMPGVSNVAIPILPHPQVISPRDFQCELLLLSQYPTRGIRFPPLHNHGEVYQRLDQHVDMAGHDAPGMKMIALAMIMQKRMLDILRYIRMRESTAAHSGIKPLLDALPAHSLPLIFRESPKFLLQLSQFCLRKTVGKAIGHGLDKV